MISSSFKFQAVPPPKESEKAELVATPLRPGDLVLVRTPAEIAATLDSNGQFEGIPFMPEMIRFCGQTLRVVRRAEKTCVEGFAMRSLANTVFLDDVRCDGANHDGCQRNCLIFWKEAWLTRVTRPDHATGAAKGDQTQFSGVLERMTRRDGKFSCQSTELGKASIAWTVPWSLSSAMADMRAGELSIKGFMGFIWRGLNNKTRRLLRLPGAGVLTGSAPQKFRGDLNLTAGEWVRVKSLEQIRGTLDASGKNCGLTFEPEMARHVGRSYRVDFPVQKIILEIDGRMIRLTNTVALEGVSCRGLCSQNCPRANTLYWREVWLERVPPP